MPQKTAGESRVNLERRLGIDLFGFGKLWIRGDRGGKWLVSERLEKGNESGLIFGVQAQP
jgi:hypothetical protein